MPDPSLGSWLRQERERRGITLKAISDQTKVSAPLLEGLEADNLTRWPEGIYRRSFVRAYATAIGLDPDEVCRRFEQEHRPATEPPADPASALAAAPQALTSATVSGLVATRVKPRLASQRARVIGTCADLTVALVLAMGSAAAGSRLLWPVLAIAAYYAIGILGTGTSPMVALLQDEAALPPPLDPDATTEQVPNRGGVDRRHQSRRNPPRAVRPARASRSRVQ